MTHMQWVVMSRRWRGGRWISPPVTMSYQEVWMSAQLVLVSNITMVTETPSLFPSGTLDGVAEYTQWPKGLSGARTDGWLGIWREFKE